MSTLVETLGSLPPSMWRPRTPADPDEVTKMEQEFGVRLPEDFRALLLYSNGGSLEGQKIEINIESVEGLYTQNYDEEFTERLPGTFVIGDDGVGGIFFYDPEARLGHGAYALFAVKLGVLGFDDAVFAAATLTEAVTLALGGADFRKRAEQ
jgi:hypothetical protein